MKILDSPSDAFVVVGVLTWDVLLTLGNLFRFNRPVGKVTPQGRPGYGGHWPEYKPPQEGDSRSSCPALNAMANHGIISRNGKGLKFTEVAEGIRSTFNLSSSFSYVLCWYAARMLRRSQRKDTFDLEEVNLHDGIEHDASLTRLDTVHQANQAPPHGPYVEEFLSFATGEDADGNSFFTNKDISRIMGKRRAVCKATNEGYNLAFIHKVFSSANSALLPVVFSRRVDDLRVLLSEERLAEGWESQARKPHGLTLHTVNRTAFAIESGIRTADWADDANEAAKPATKG